MTQRQEIVICSPEHCCFTIQAKEHIKIGATLLFSYLYTSEMIHVGIVTFIETELRMQMIKYDFIIVCLN